eukprot:CAMPEP_0168610422 /NCGR_PEP_ID=MMETSP0449_2-20121227/1775_1 /TAXON_ID=1082188 /ORGANISM="Strombidium rassoulzadegani, Strain ras09" /LENGTH=111 /DNA_ID=CAMNT_0008650719 /DNA_START=261 /DNA_END=596 /DNA_ORIENTATION=-
MSTDELSPLKGLNLPRQGPNGVPFQCYVVDQSSLVNMLQSFKSNVRELLFDHAQDSEPLNEKIQPLLSWFRRVFKPACQRYQNAMLVQEIIQQRGSNLDIKQLGYQSGVQL